VVGGIWLGLQANAKNPKISPNGGNEDCSSSCSDLHHQHHDLCVAQENLAAAEAHANRMLAAMLALGGGVVAVIASIMGAASLIAAITALVGTPVAIGIFIAGIFIAYALWLLLIASLAAWVTAQAVAGDKRRIKSELTALKREALDNVEANCTAQEVQDCVNSLIPC
jgi:hypothetical protein